MTGRFKAGFPNRHVAGLSQLRSIGKLAAFKKILEIHLEIIGMVKLINRLLCSCNDRF